MEEKTEVMKSDSQKIADRYRIVSQEYSSDIYKSYITFDEKMERNVRIIVITGDSSVLSEKCRPVIGTTQNLKGVYRGIDYVCEDSKLYYVEESDDAVSLKNNHSKECNAEIVCKKIADILKELHSKGIIFANLRPETVFINDMGEVKLGHIIAGQFSVLAGNEKTLSLESKQYFAPEQCGTVSDKISDKTDIYSLCVLYLWLKTGEQPYSFTIPVTGDELIDRLIPNADIIKRGIEKKPSDRTATLSELSDFLFSEDKTIPMRSSGIITEEKTDNDTKKRPWLKWVIIAAVAGAAAVIILMFSVFIKPVNPPEVNPTEIAENLYDRDYSDIFVDGETINNTQPSDGVYGAENLTIPGSDLKFLENKEYEGLKELRLTGAKRNHLTKLNDLTGIENLSDSLEKLFIDKNDEITGLEPLGNMQKLKLLSLQEDRNIEDYTPLTKINSLESLNMRSVRSDIISEDEFVNRLKVLSGCTGLKALSLYDNNLHDISFLSAFDNIEVLDLRKNDITDYTSLSEMDSLKKLLIDTNMPENFDFLRDGKLVRLSMVDIDKIKSISEIAGDQDVESLKSISLQDCKNLEDIKGVEKFINLEGIHLSGTKITDISALKTNKNIKSIDIRNTGVKDITPLSWFPDLELLYMNNLHIDDLTPISKLTALEKLSIKGNDIKDLDALKDMVNLKILGCDKCTQLENMKGLKNTNLSRFYLSDAPLTDLEGLEGSTDLEILQIKNCPVTDISMLEKFTDLNDLQIVNTGVTDFSSLKGMKNLKSLSLEGSRISDVSILEGLTDLEYLNIKNTGISKQDVYKLQSILGDCEIVSDY